MDGRDLIDWTERFAYLALATAFLAGIVLAIVFWSRHPQQSLLLLFACGLLLAHELAYVATWTFPAADDFIDFELIPALNAATPFVRLIGFTLLLLAVLTGRGPRQPELMDYDDRP